MGTAKISAAQGTTVQNTITGSTMLTVSNATLVSIVLAPQPTASIAKGTKIQFKATGFFSDTSTQDLTDTATWASSTANATISNAADSNGLATGALVGTANITAALVTPE